MTESEINQIKAALRKCAEENEGKPTYTGNVVISSVCRAAADRIEELERAMESLVNFHSQCVEAFISQSPRDDHEMASAGREIFELLYPNDERLKDLYD